MLHFLHSESDHIEDKPIHKFDEKTIHEKIRHMLPDSEDRHFKEALNEMLVKDP